MSIWSDIACDRPDLAITGAEIGAPDVDIRRGTGPQTLAINLATATSWHGSYRLSIFPDQGINGPDIAVLLDRTNLERLRAKIDHALAKNPAPVEQADVNQRRRSSVNPIEGFSLSDPADRERICEWLRANNLDPDQIAAHSPICVIGETLVVVYVVRDEAGNIRLDGNLPMIREHAVPLIRPFTAV